MLVSVLMLAGCGYTSGGQMMSVDPSDMNAIISLPNGEIIEGDVDGFYRYSEVYIEVMIDGTVYGVHPHNVAFISSPQ